MIYIHMSDKDKISFENTIDFTTISTSSPKGSYLFVEIDDGSVLEKESFGNVFTSYAVVEELSDAYWIKEKTTPRENQQTTLLHLLYILYLLLCLLGIL